MIKSRQAISPSPGERFAGFTILEMVVVLAIAAALAGLSIPYLSGMLHENQMREPVRELQDLAKTVRARAAAERVAYEIVFTQDGFLGRVHTQYRDDDQDGSDVPAAHPSGEEGEAAVPTPEPTPDETAAGADSPEGAVAPPAPSPELVAYRFAAGMACRFLFWGSDVWIEPGPEGDPEAAPWVFQPSGLCNPLRVRFQKEDAWIEVAFNPLTADIQEERYQFPD